MLSILQTFLPDAFKLDNMPNLLGLEEEVFLREDDQDYHHGVMDQDYHHGVMEDRSRRFQASFIGCCDLQPGRENIFQTKKLIKRN